jgi:hypothetical protein
MTGAHTVPGRSAPGHRRATAQARNTPIWQLVIFPAVPLHPRRALPALLGPRLVSDQEPAQPLACPPDHRDLVGSVRNSTVLGGGRLLARFVL